MHPSIVGMLRAAATLLAAAEIGGTAARQRESALLYVLWLLRRYPGDPAFERVAGASPALQRVLLAHSCRPPGEPLH